MAAAKVLLDTGPLVALLSASDARHGDAVAAWNRLSPPLVTCWPVLTEAAWLLRTEPAAEESLLQSATIGLFRIAPLNEDDSSAIAVILRRYRKLRPQLADASLVHLAYREGIRAIFTFDQRDFRVYRAPRNKAFHTLP